MTEVTVIPPTGVLEELEHVKSNSYFVYENKLYCKIENISGAAGARCFDPKRGLVALPKAAMVRKVRKVTIKYED